MKKPASRLLSSLLALCMVLAMLPGTALAADEDFVIEDNILTEYNGPGGAVTVPYGVTNIWDYAFSGCEDLTSVSIPGSVEDIGPYAFSGCENLTEFIVADDNPFYKSVDGVLLSNDGTLLCTYPAGKSAAAYTIPSSVSTIGNSAFSGCKNLTGVTIPDSVTIIAESAFWHCTALTGVTIPDSVTSIGDYAFYQCSALTNVKISKNVTVIGEAAFEGCTSLASVSIPAGVTVIESMAFLDVPASSIVVPDGVTGIGDLALGFHTVVDASTGMPETEPISGFTVVGAAGTAAQQYAADNGFKFVPSVGTAYDKYSPLTVDIDGTKVPLRVYALEDANGSPTNYVLGRDLAAAMSKTKAPFTPRWDGQAGVINFVTGEAFPGSENPDFLSGERSYRIPSELVYVNGAPSDLLSILLTDDNGGGSTYYKIRDLGRTLGFNVGMSAERGIFIESDKPYTSAD